jgi:hypothetical protein
VRQHSTVPGTVEVPVISGTTLGTGIHGALFWIADGSVHARFAAHRQFRDGFVSTAVNTVHERHALPVTCEVGAVECRDWSPCGPLD